METYGTKSMTKATKTIKQCKETQQIGYSLETEGKKRGEGTSRIQSYKNLKE